MISVGIDVSKGKSTVCILKPYGEIVCSPFEMQHVEKELDGLDSILRKLDGEIRIVMEATGIYHLPVLTYLTEKGYFVSVVNPFVMKSFAKDNNFRGAKTDKLDSVMIANYGIEKWFKLQKYEGAEEVYAELKLLGRRYRYYMELHVKALQELTHILDYVMPGIKKKFNSWNESSNKDKLSDFVEKFWHYDVITSMGLEKFKDEYLLWAKEKKYHRSISKAEEVYELASGGIPTLSSSTPSTKMLVQEAVSVLKAIDSSLATILARMQVLAKSLPEYSTVRNTFRHKMQYDLNDFYRHNDSYEAIFRLYRNVSANRFLFEVVDDYFGIEKLTNVDKDHFHYVVIDLCEEELFPGTEQMYQTMVYDVESGNFWLGEDCDHLNAYGKCAIEGYRADTDLLAYVEGKWEVPEYQTFYEFLCSMDWLKNT